jgi:hypothetical protein
MARFDGRDQPGATHRICNPATRGIACNYQRFQVLEPVLSPQF